MEWAYSGEELGWRGREGEELRNLGAFPALYAGNRANQQPCPEAPRRKAGSWVLNQKKFNKKVLTVRNIPPIMCSLTQF
jgi:hypothetical protein